MLSNPPYVSEPEWEGLEPEVRDHDPRAALVAGPTGLEAYEALIPASHQLLSPAGHLILELGFEQADSVRERVEAGGFRIVEILPDMQQFPRILVARRP